MNVRFSGLAAAAALLATAALPQAADAATNFALSTAGASFVSGSSIIPLGTFGLAIDHLQMQLNLLTNTPSAAINNGDTRYIFDANDADANIVIDLGQLRQIGAIGASATLPSMGDRFVLGPFTADVSTDGVTFTPFGGSLAVDGSSANPLQLTGPAQSAQFIRYHFGVSPDYFSGGGSAVNQLFAEGAGVPEPGTWVMLIGGLGLAGAALRRKRTLAGSATA
jgi:hypothetical protein